MAKKKKTCDIRNEIISIAMNIILTELPVFPGSSKFGASSLSRRHSWAYIELYFGSSRAFSKTLKFKTHISHFTFTWIMGCEDRDATVRLAKI